MLLHRDYTASSSVMIRVYDDRVTVTSPGGLPEGVTVGDLYRDPHPSKRRNPLLAEAFYYASIVERWGTGTIRMARLCRAQGLPEPEFQATPWEVVVTFAKDPYTEDRLHARGLSERQVKVVLFAREHGGITNRDFRQLFNLSHEAAHNELDALVRLGLLHTEGRGRSLRYVLDKVDE
jgi:ATP-dependent DNA helicase RecG